MREDLANALIKATGERNRVGKRPNSERTQGRIFTTILFACISLFLLLALYVGMNSYRTSNAIRTAADESRLGLSLIANSIHMNDTTDAVCVSTGPEGPALVLTERLETGVFETRLYAYQGAVVQEYARAGAAYTPEKSREIVKSNRFDFTFNNDLLTVYTDQGATAVALRSVRGGV